MHTVVVSGVYVVTWPPATIVWLPLQLMVISPFVLDSTIPVKVAVKGAVPTPGMVWLMVIDKLAPVDRHEPIAVQLKLKDPNGAVVVGAVTVVVVTAL